MLSFIHLFTFRSQRIQSFIDGIKSVNELVLNELVSSNLHHLHAHNSLQLSPNHGGRIRLYDI